MEVSRNLTKATRSLCRFTTSSFLAPLLRRTAAPCTATATATRSFSSALILSASGTPRPLTDKEKSAREKFKRRKKKHRSYMQHDLKDMQQFTLCEAMRWAMESRGPRCRAAADRNVDILKLSNSATTLILPNTTSTSSYAQRRMVPSSATPCVFPIP